MMLVVTLLRFLSVEGNVRSESESDLLVISTVPASRPVIISTIASHARQSPDREERLETRRSVIPTYIVDRQKMTPGVGKSVYCYQACCHKHTTAPTTVYGALSN